MMHLTDLHRVMPYVRRDAGDSYEPEEHQEPARSSVLERVCLAAIILLTVFTLILMWNLADEARQSRASVVQGGVK